MEHILESELALPLPIDEVFPFFAEPENLERITPNSMRFNIITPPPITMKRGALIDYKLSLFGIPFKWKTEITRYEPPYVFVDEQLKGPVQALGSYPYLRANRQRDVDQGSRPLPTAPQPAG